MSKEIRERQRLRYTELRMKTEQLVMDLKQLRSEQAKMSFAMADVQRTANQALALALTAQRMITEDEAERISADES